MMTEDFTERSNDRIHDGSEGGLGSEPAEGNEDDGLLRALAEAAPEPLRDPEREYVWAAIRRRRAEDPWRGAWKVVVAAALLLMGFGVWRLHLTLEAEGWDPAPAIAAWEADLDELRPAPAEVRLGAALLALPLPASAPAFAQQPSQEERAEADAEVAARLVDRFADRAAQALALDEGRTERLREVLQASRRGRVELLREAASARRELTRLARQGMRDDIRADRLLEEMVRIQRRQAELGAEEQRRLAEFLTPTERVRLVWLRQRLLSRALERRREAPFRPRRHGGR